MMQERTVRLAILIAGLGFFIDSFDAFLFNVVRVQSLTDLGLSGDALTQAGIYILSSQVMGTLAGGFLWGVLGDRIGRKTALLGSIALYSGGMIASAFVHDVDAYALARAVTGLGIAGEVGLGATLVGEMLKTTKRTFGMAFFTVLGLLGVVAAALAAEMLPWRTAYLVGGIAGYLLLLARHLLSESPLFAKLKDAPSARGRFAEIVAHVQQASVWISCIFILAPNFFVTGFLLTLAPELAQAGGVPVTIKANIALAVYFICAVAGDLAGAWLSELAESRRRILCIYMAGNALLAVWFLHAPPHTAAGFYTVCAVFGFFNLWALSATTAVELFRTQLRATVTTTATNIARACLMPMNMAFLVIRTDTGTTGAATIIGMIVFSLGFAAIFALPETWGRNLNDIPATRK